MTACRHPRRTLLAGLAVLTVALLGLASASAAFKYLQVGVTAPPVRGEDLLTGETVNSVPGDDDQVLLVLFWATWSPRSIEQLKAMREFRETYGDHPFGVVAVNVDRETMDRKAREAVRDLVRELDLDFPVVIDEGLEMFNEFGVIAVPSTAVLDSTRTLRYGPSGYSLTIKDLLIDSTEVLLGLRERGAASVAKPLPARDPVAIRNYGMAVQLYAQRMHEKALEYIDRSLEADAGFAAPLALRGEIRLELGDPAAAVESYAAAVARDSSIVAAMAGLGRALLLNGDQSAACSTLESALVLDPTYTPALVDISRCHLAKGDTSMALSALQEAGSLNSRDPAVHHLMGAVHRARGELAAAVSDYRRALDLLFPAP